MSAETDRAITTPDRKKVFVVHGRNAAARKAMFSFLRAIGLQPMEWHEAVSLSQEGSPYVGQILDRAFAVAQAIVVLITGNDVARLNTCYLMPHDPSYERDLTPQARPNVLFEAGMAFGRNPQRTVLVELGYTRPYSDIGGRHVIRMSNHMAHRQGLAERLESAGCAVEWKGRTDWHEEGDFDAAIQAPDGTAPAESSSSHHSQPLTPSLSLRWAGSNNSVLEILDLPDPPQLSQAEVSERLDGLRPTDEEIALVRAWREEFAKQSHEEDAVSTFRRYIEKRLELARSDFEQFCCRYALESRAVQPSFQIINEGTTPAINIVIYISATDKVLFCTFKELRQLNIGIPDRRPQKVIELIER